MNTCINTFPINAELRVVVDIGLFFVERREPYYNRVQQTRWERLGRLSSCIDHPTNYRLSKQDAEELQAFRSAERRIKA